MKRLSVAVCGVILLFGLMAHAQDSKKPRAGGYDLTLVQAPYSTQTYLTGVNEPHRVVGYSFDGGNPFTAISFQWWDGAFTKLDPAAPFVASVPAAQNNSGVVVGSSLMPAAGQQIKAATLWQEGTAGVIGPAVGPADESSSWATGINEDGKVVITSVKVVVTPQFTLQFINSSWTWQDGETTMLPDPRSGGCASASGINDPGLIVGTSCGSSSYKDQAMLWIDGEGQLLGTLQGVDDAGNVKGASTGNAINNRGQVVGYSTFSDSSTAAHAFLWDRGAMLDLFPGVNNIASTAVAINNSTQVVGYFKQTGAPTEHAFVWDNGQAYDLNSLINEPDPRILLIRAFAINARGDISGVALDFRSGAMKVTGFLLTPTN